MKSYLMKHIRFILIALVVIVLAIYCGTIAWYSYTDYCNTLESSKKEAQGYVRALAEHAARTMAESDVALSAVAKEISDHGGIDHFGKDEFHKLAVSQIKRSPQILDFFFVDAKGHLIASSRIYPVKSVTVKVREYFRHHSDDANPDSFVGRPIRNYFDNRWSFSLTRRFCARDGSFAGVVGVLLDMKYFETFYRSITIGDQGKIALFRSDGIMLLQTPFFEKDLNADYSSMLLFALEPSNTVTGTFMETTNEDFGSKRIVAYASLPEYPVVAAVSLLQREVLGAWKRRLYAQSASAAILVLLTILLTLVLLRGLTELITKQGQLQGFNESLELLVQKEVSKNRKMDQLMINQSRQAAMGEMINSIAHQWRQPLNNLGLIIQNTSSEFDAGLLTPEQMALDMKQCMEQIEFMSQIIDDFRNFFSEDKAVVRFSISQVISRSFRFVDAVMKNHGIRLVAEESEDLQIDGYPNKLAQVLLTLLNNAKDALVDKRISRPEIVVRLFREANQAVLTVSDNAGGIFDDLIDQTFEPHFSTGEISGEGGIGLYLSKIIIEKHMGGKLTAKSISLGARFRIELKLTHKEEKSVIVDREEERKHLTGLQCALAESTQRK